MTIYFYNPNIHPEEEYLHRKHELVQYAIKRGVSCVDADYDPDMWLDYVKGHEMDKERGDRCRLCFEFRLYKTAAYAAEHEFSLISSTLGISRRKNFDQVTDAGRRAATQFPGISYLDYNWRKNGGIPQMDLIVEHEQFYRQKYCGCIFSKKPH
jgi:predicted adenine nucleotide alpha hydrolase (AANH) superfamily ATPase